MDIPLSFHQDAAIVIIESLPRISLEVNLNIKGNIITFEVFQAICYGLNGKSCLQQIVQFKYGRQVTSDRGSVESENLGL